MSDKESVKTTAVEETADVETDDTESGLPPIEEDLDVDELEEKGVVEQALSGGGNDAVFENYGEEEQTPEQDFKEVYDELEEEFGDVTDILIDVYYDPRVRNFLLKHHERIAEINRERANKARFYFHREPTDEIYLLLSPRPSEFNTAWLAMRTEYAKQAYDKYADGMLRTIMEYPKYDDVDWDLNGDGIYAPMGLTKSRLIDTFLKHELVDPEEQNTAAFEGNDVDDAMTVANRRDKRTDKPSL